MGCCLNCVRSKAPAQNKIHSQLAKSESKPALSAKDDKPTARPNHIIRLDKKVLIRESDSQPPPLKVIYSKKIMSRESEFIQIPSPNPILRGESNEFDSCMSPNPSSIRKATISNLEEGSSSRHHLDEKEAPEHKEMSKTEDSATENFIEVNSLHFLSKLQKDRKPKVVSRKNSSLSPVTRASRGIIRETDRSDWLREYNNYVKKQMSNTLAPVIKRDQAGFVQPISPSFIILPAESEKRMSSQQLVFPRGLSNYNQLPPMVRPDHHHRDSPSPTKFALGSLRRRNQTTPDLNKLAEIGARQAMIKSIKESRLQQDETTSRMTEDEGQNSNGKSANEAGQSKGGMGSSDSLGLPAPTPSHFQNRKHFISSITKPQINKHHLHRYSSTANQIIPEQKESEESEDFRDENKSVDKGRKAAPNLASDMRNRNKSALPTMNSEKNKESIFGKIVVSIPIKQTAKENSKIKETEDESRESELFGDRFFEGSDSSHSREH